MNNLRALAATIGLAACVLGVMMVFPAERQAGHALVIGGAIIFAGVLIAADN